MQGSARKRRGIRGSADVYYGRARATEILDTYTLTRTSGSLPTNEYFGFTSNTLEAARFKDGTSDCTGTHYFCFTISNIQGVYSEYTALVHESV